MDGGFNIVGSVILIVYVCVFNVIIVKFSDIVIMILVFFDIDIDIVNDDEICENFFIVVVVVIFGIDVECYLSSWWEVNIFFGVGVNVIIGDSLVFKDNVF